MHTGENVYKNRKSAGSEVTQSSTDLSYRLEFVCRCLKSPAVIHHIKRIRIQVSELFHVFSSKSGIVEKIERFQNFGKFQIPFFVQKIAFHRRYKLRSNNKTEVFNLQLILNMRGKSNCLQIFLSSATSYYVNCKNIF